MKKDDLNQTVNLLNKFIVSIIEKCSRDSLTDNKVRSQNKETFRNNLDNSFNIYKNKLKDSLITLFPEKRIKTYTKVEDTKVFISNLNTYSALLDRLIAENMKLYHYNIDLNDYRLKSKKKKKESLERIVDCLKKELYVFIKRTFDSGSFVYEKEQRSFRPD